MKQTQKTKNILENLIAENVVELHELYHKSELAKNQEFNAKSKALTTTFLNAFFLENKEMQLSSQQSQAIKSLVNKLYSALKRPIFTMALEQRWTEEVIPILVLEAFALACISTWFDFKFGEKICQVDFIGIPIVKDNTCGSIRKYRNLVLKRLKLLYLTCSKFTNTKMASLPSLRDIIHPKVKQHIQRLK